MNNSTVINCNDENWEASLIEWEKKFPPLTLGLLLAEVIRGIADPLHYTLLDEIKRQYQDPCSTRRQKIFNTAEIQGFDTPAGALALSQFFSAGSLAPDDLPPVYPPSDLSNKMLHSVAMMVISDLASQPAEGFQQLVYRCNGLGG